MYRFYFSLEKSPGLLLQKAARIPQKKKTIVYLTSHTHNTN